MTHEELKKKRESVNRKIEELNKQIDEIRKKKMKVYQRFSNILDKFAKDHQEYPDGTILKIRARVGKAFRYKIVKVCGSFVENGTTNVRLRMKAVMKYDDRKVEPGAGDRYYLGWRYEDCYEYDIIKVLNEDDIKTCSCDTCQWLEAYRNTIGTEDGPLLHCGILIDKEVYDEGRPACDRYSWWTWSRTCGNRTHRQQLLEDNGEMSQGEKHAHEMFSKKMEDMYNKQQENGSR